MMRRILFEILLYLCGCGKGVCDMAMIYALLIVKGKKSFADVPVKLRDQVREILIDMEVPESLYQE